jgi:hypothetical protein
MKRLHSHSFAEAALAVLSCLAASASSLQAGGLVTEAVEHIERDAAKMMAEKFAAEPSPSATPYRFTPEQRRIIAKMASTLDLTKPAREVKKDEQTLAAGIAEAEVHHQAPTASSGLTAAQLAGIRQLLAEQASPAPTASPR